jgi:hypothetical protein
MKIKNSLYCAFTAVVCAFCMNNVCIAGESKSAEQLVTDFFDIVYSNDALTESVEMRFFPSSRNDVRACLRAVPEYSDSKAPILEFLRSERARLFRTNDRDEIAIFSKSHVLGKSENTAQHDFVFAMVRWDKRSATPPALIVMFIFDREQQGAPVSGPDFMEAPATISLFDAAMTFRDEKKKK